MEAPPPGTALPPLDKGRLTASHLVRWCAAQENWDRIHYDRTYAREVAGLPDVVVNGALKQQFLAQFATAPFGEKAWLWRLGCRFRGPDLVGQQLRVEGSVRAVERQARVTAVHLDLRIVNVDTGRATTEGEAVVLLPGDGADKPDSLPALYRDEIEAHSPASPDPAVPASIRRHVGTDIDHIVSFSPVEPGRLRLFAEAVMDLPPRHYDPHAEDLAAPPLFPLHAMSWPPGAHPLDASPTAMGREAVCEVGHDVAQRFGLPPQGMLNGGMRARIHRLARPGDTVQAACHLRDVRHRVGATGAPMLIFETENRYATTTGHLLLEAWQTTLLRLT